MPTFLDKITLFSCCTLEYIQGIDFDRDGNKIATFSDDASLTISNVVTDKVLLHKKFEEEDRKLNKKYLQILTQLSEYSLCQWNPKSFTIALTTSNVSINILDPIKHHLVFSNDQLIHESSISKKICQINLILFFFKNASI